MASSAPERPVIFQHPLAYLLGLQGIALLRAFAGEYDRQFTLARLAEMRELLERPDAFGAGAEARPRPLGRLRRVGSLLRRAV